MTPPETSVADLARKCAIEAIQFGHKGVDPNKSDWVAFEKAMKPLLDEFEGRMAEVFSDTFRESMRRPKAQESATTKETVEDLARRLALTAEPSADRHVDPSWKDWAEFDRLAPEDRFSKQQYRTLFESFLTTFAAVLSAKLPPVSPEPFKCKKCGGYSEDPILCGDCETENSERNDK